MNTDATQVLADPAILPVQCTPCMEKLDKRPWHGTLAVQVGGYIVGVRADSASTYASLDEVLRPLRKPAHDAEVSPNFSVELGEESAGRRRQLHIVYRQHEVAARRRERAEALTDVLELLDEVPMSLSADRPVVHAGVVVGPRGAVLFPGRLASKLLTRRSDLEATGLELLQSQVHAVRPSGEALIIDRAAEDLSRLVGDRRGDGVREIPIHVWATPIFADQCVELRPAHGVFAAVNMVPNRGLYGMGGTLRMLQGAAKTARFAGMPELSPARVSEAVKAMSS